MTTLFNVSLWGDEAFSALAAQKSFWQMMTIVIKDTSPPLFYIVSFLWFRIFGSSEIAIRSLSFLFYLATMIIIYFIGKTLFDKKTGLLATILSFFNPFLFPYAFEGRMYYCLLFFTTLSFYFLIIQNRWGYILAATAALYSHHFAIFALGAQFLWLLAIKRNFREVFKTYLIIGLLYLPWVYPLYLQTSRVTTGFWLGKPKLKELLGSFKNLLSQGPFAQFQAKIPILALLVLLFRKWQRQQLSKDLLLLLWALFPPLATFLISQTSLSIFYGRYFLYCVPPLMILLVSQTRKVSYLLLAPLLIIYPLTAWHQFTHPFKRPFRELAYWIKENVPENVFIVNYNGAAHHLWESKYYGIEAPIYSPGGPLPFYVGTAQMTDKDVIYQLPESQPIGLISSDPPQSIKIEGYRVDHYHQIDSLYFIWLKKENEKEKS